MVLIKRYWLILLTVILLSFPEAAIAQSPSVTIINGTMPVSIETRAIIQAYLDAHPPSGAAYYAVTYFLDKGFYQFVSMAGLNLSSPDEAWSLEAKDGQPSQVVWVGTLKVFMDGSVEMYSSNPTMAGGGHLAALVPNIIPKNILPAGGGAYVSFPFDHSAMYGPRGVHGSGDYGTSGMYAVDLVGGSSLGTNVMSSRVYASDTGTVDYVCSDSTSAAIRTHNTATGDYFVYAHMLDNANLELDHNFSKGGVIGTLKSGSFTDTCGWADQSAGIYHVHWMFAPAGGNYRVSGYTLNISDEKFHIGQQAIGAGGWLVNSSNVGTGGDDPGGNTGATSFWDNPVNAVVAFVAGQIAPLPEHTSPVTLLRSVINGIDLVFRLAYVFAKGNLNLAPFMVMLGVIIVFKLLFGLVWVIWWVIRAIYNLIPTAA